MLHWICGEAVTLVNSIKQRFNEFNSKFLCKKKKICSNTFDHFQYSLDLNSLDFFLFFKTWKAVFTKTVVDTLKMIEEAVAAKNIPKTNFTRAVEFIENNVPTVVYNLMVTNSNNKKIFYAIFADFFKCSVAVILKFFKRYEYTVIYILQAKIKWKKKHKCIIAYFLKKLIKMNLKVYIYTF